MKTPTYIKIARKYEKYREWLDLAMAEIKRELTRE